MASHIDAREATNTHLEAPSHTSNWTLIKIPRQIGLIKFTLLVTHQVHAIVQILFHTQ